MMFNKYPRRSEYRLVSKKDLEYSIKELNQQSGDSPMAISKEGVNMVTEATNNIIMI